MLSSDAKVLRVPFRSQFRECFLTEKRAGLFKESGRITVFIELDKPLFQKIIPFRKFLQDLNQFAVAGTDVQVAAFQKNRYLR